MRAKSQFTIAVAALAAFFPTTTGAREPLRLAPASGWSLHRDEDKCRLVRTFGAGEDQVVLMLHQSGPQVAFNVWAIGHPLADPSGARIGIAFGPDGSEKVRGYIRSTRTSRGAPYVFLHGVSIASPDQHTSPDATDITLSKALRGPVTLETGALAEPVEQLRTCAVALAETLGHGRLSQAGFVQSPQPATNPGQWLNSSDYPQSALATRKEGIVRFRLTVNKQGKASSCYIESRESEPDVFEDQVCLLLMQRASFKPALDAEGKPVAAYWSSSVRFEIR